jgi:hypothetical protein
MMASTPRNVKFGKYIRAGQDIFMTVKLGAVKAPYRRLRGDAKLLESQLFHDAAASVVAVEVPDADRLRAKVAERVTNSGVCSLRRYALSGVFPRHPINGLIDVGCRTPKPSKLQVIPGIFLGGLDSIQILKSRRTQN